MPSVATKERIHQLVDSLPDTPETELRLDAIAQELEPNGNGVGDNDHVEERRIPTFEESIAKLANFDFLPREDAWR